GHLAHGPDGAARRRDARRRASRAGRGDRPAHPAPARSRHDPDLRPQDEPLRDRRGGLAPRGSRREPRGARVRAGLRRSRRAGAACLGGGRPHALLQAAGGHRLPARGAGHRRGADRTWRATAGFRRPPRRGRLMADIVMPRLSDTMEEGTILRWLAADGQEIHRGDELVEIETDKATMVYESDQDGVLHTIASEGDSLPVGELIARVGDNGVAAMSTAGET